VLTITVEEVLRIARLDATNAGDVADAAAVIADEQAAQEVLLRPDSLADADAIPLLRRAVAKLLAAELLETRARAEGAGGSFDGLGLSFGPPPPHADSLRAEARRALASHLRAGSLGAQWPGTHSPASVAAQAERFGGKG